MVIFFIVLLGISIVGILSLLSVRRYEMQSDRMVLAQVRPTISGWLGLLMDLIERVAPALVRYWGRRLWRYCSECAHRAIAWGVLRVERALERTLRTLRHATSPQGAGEASAFLREVAEHKEQLKRSSEERAIYEE